MLTATPIQNDLKELYNLIGLIKPGQLGSYRSFKSRFIQDKRTPKNPQELKELLSQVMVRNRRDEGTVQFTQRIVHPIIVSLTSKEHELYNRVTQFVRARGRRSGLQNILPSSLCSGKSVQLSWQPPSLWKDDGKHRPGSADGGGRTSQRSGRC